MKPPITTESDQSEKRFRVLFESSRDAMMTLEPPLWKFTSANSAAVAMFRAKNVEEFISYGPGSLSPDRQPDGHASAEKAKEMSETAIREGFAFFEWTHKRLDGEEFPTTVLLSRIETGDKQIVQATVRDISEQKRAEDALHLFRDLVEHSSDAIGMSTPDGRHYYQNEAFDRLFGDVGDSPPATLYVDQAIGKQVFDTIMGGRSWQGEVQIFKKDRTILDIFVRAYAIQNQDGRILGLVGLHTDITDRKRAEEAIRRSKAEAERANAAKSMLLANMSHEIRTPMTAILGFAEMVASPLECCTTCPEHQGCPTRAQSKEHIQIIQRNGQHLLGLINDILDLSKIEAGKMEVERVPCSPVQIVEEAVSLMRVRAVENGLSLNARYEFPLPETILSDPARIRQILINLTDNAVKFTPEGHVEIVVRCITDAQAQRAVMAFDIKDSGIGMTPEQIGRLFQPFAQADTSTTRQYRGTGLGLAISKRLAEALGGDIQVASRLWEGSTFTFTIATQLPQSVHMLSDISQAAVRAPHQPQSASPAIARLRGRLLLAEDGPDNQKLISTILRTAGAEVDVASNGRIAVEKALAALSAGTPYDAILMDIQMPEMDGYEATRHLRQAGYGQAIVALTAHAMAGDRQKCLAASCDDYATKPVDRASLLATLARLMGSPELEPGEGPAVAEPKSPASDAAIGSAFRSDPDMAGIITEFVGQLPQHLTDMRQAAANNQWDALQRAAHQLKGAGGSYGYACLTDAAGQLESHAQQQDAEAAMLALNKLSRLCPRIQAGHEPKSAPQDARTT